MKVIKTELEFEKKKSIPIKYKNSQKIAKRKSLKKEDFSIKKEQKQHKESFIHTQVSITLLKNCFKTEYSESIDYVKVTKE